MRIKDLTESFDTEVSREVIHASPDRTKLKARVGDRDIIFDARVHKEDELVVADIEFYEQVGNTEFYDVTGSGSEMKVFSFIFDSVRDVVTDYDPDIISFESRKSEGNRTKLYKKMVSRFPAYEIAEVRTEGNMDVFIVVKKDK